MLQLLDLPPDLIRAVVVAVVKTLDAVSLERFGGACRVLLILSREVAAWHSLLLAHFDGELPPALSQTMDPRAALRETTRFARALIDRELQAQVLQLPLGMCADRSAIEMWHASAEYVAWRNQIFQRRLDAGTLVPRIEQNRNLLIERTITSYGRYVRVVELDKLAAEARMTKQEATISTWLEYAPAAVEDDGRYAEIASWLDARMTPLVWDLTLARLGSAAASRLPGFDLEEAADVRELVAKHGLGAAQALNLMRAPARGEAAHTLVPQGGSSWRLVPRRTERPIAATKVLTGLYGGLFAYDNIGDAFGGCYVKLTCLADGRRRYWEDTSKI